MSQDLGGKRDVTHLIYVKIKPYLISLLFLAKTGHGFKLFPQKVNDEIKFQNASKRQIKIIYFYVIKMPLYKIIAGDSQTHITLGSGTQTSPSSVARFAQSDECITVTVKYLT